MKTNYLEFRFGNKRGRNSVREIWLGSRGNYVNGGEKFRYLVQFYMRRLNRM